LAPDFRSNSTVCNWVSMGGALAPGGGAGGGGGPEQAIVKGVLASSSWELTSTPAVMRRSTIRKTFSSRPDTATDRGVNPWAAVTLTAAPAPNKAFTTSR